MNVARFVAGHEGLGSNYIRRLTGTGEFNFGHLAQIIACRLQREHAAGGTNVSAKMYPGGASLGNRAFSPRSARHEVVETEMAEFMTAIGGETHFASGWSRNQRTQCFEPANEAAAPLCGRLPPRAARCHNNYWWGGAAGVTDHDTHAAGSRRNISGVFVSVHAGDGVFGSLRSVGSGAV
jgi:hypothetical protein